MYDCMTVLTQVCHAPRVRDEVQGLACTTREDDLITVSAHKLGDL
jgi:hypothetical protein